MDKLLALGTLGDVALLAGLASTRVAVAFLLMPLFSPDTVPAMVRNAVFLSLGVLSLALQPTLALGSLNAVQWLGLFGKEALLGLGLGFGLAAFLWAFEAAGAIIDTKVAVANGQISDPMSGQQLSPTGALLGRLASFLFMFGGGFLLFVGVLLESFAIWPVARTGLSISPGSVSVFEAALSRFALLSFLLAAPALLLLYVVDLALGLVNRFAPQVNLISISMSLKSVAAGIVWLLLFGVLVDSALWRIAEAVRGLLPQMQRVGG